MSDLTYFDGEYFDGKYFGIVADASATVSASASLSAAVQVADTEGYYIPDYIANGYYQLPIVEASASLSSSVSLSATTGFLLTSSFDVDTLFTPTISVNVKVNPFATLDTSANIAVSAERTRSIDAGLNVSSELVVAFGNIQQFEADLQTSASTTTANSRVRGFDADVGTLFDASISVIAEFAVSATLNNSASLSADLDRFRSTDVTLSTIVNLSLQGDRTRDYNLAAAGTFTVSADYLRIRQDSPTLTSQTALSATISHIEGAELVAFTNGSLTVSAVKTTSITENYDAEYTIDLLGGKLKQTTANLNSLFVPYLTKWVGSERPRNLQDFQVSTLQKKFGTHSLFFNNINSSYYTPSSEEYYIPANTDFVFETWVYGDFAGTFSQEPAMITFGSGPGGQNTTYETFVANEISWTLGEDFSGDLQFKWRNGAQLGVITGSAGPGSSGWNHIAIQRDNGTLRLKLNGSQVGSASFTGAFYNPTTSPKIYWGHASGNSQNDLFYDATTMRIGDSTITGLSSYPTNDETTLFLYKFDGNGLDYLGFELFGEADLTTTTSISFSSTVVYNETFDLNSSFSIDATAGKLEEINLTAFGSATVSAQPERIMQFASSQNTAFTQQNSVDLFKAFDSSISSNFAQSALLGIEKQFDSTMSAFAFDSAVANKIGNTLVAIDVVAQQTASAVKTTDIDETLPAIATQTANGIIQVTAGSFVFASFDLDVIEAVRIRFGALSVSMSATAQTLPSYTFDQDADLQTSASTEGTASGIIRATATLPAQFTQPDTTADRFAEFDSALATSVVQTATATKVVDPVFDLQSAFTRSIDYVRIRNIGVDTDAVASTLTAAVKTGNALVAIDVVSLSTASSIKTTDIIENYTGVFALTIPGEVLRSPAESTQSTAFSLTALGNVSIEADADLGTQATQTASALKTTDIQEQLNTASNLTATPFRLLPFATITVAFGTLSCAISRIRPGASTVNSTATVSANGGYLAAGSASIAVVNAFTVSIRAIHPEIIVYTIPAETRIHTIKAETRFYEIGGY